MDFIKKCKKEILVRGLVGIILTVFIIYFLGQTLSSAGIGILDNPIIFNGLIYGIGGLLVGIFTIKLKHIPIEASIVMLFILVIDIITFHTNLNFISTIINVFAQFGLLCSFGFLVHLMRAVWG